MLARAPGGTGTSGCIRGCTGSRPCQMPSALGPGPDGEGMRSRMAAQPFTTLLIAASAYWISARGPFDYIFTGATSTHTSAGRASGANGWGWPPRATAAAGLQHPCAHGLGPPQACPGCSTRAASPPSTAHWPLQHHAQPGPRGAHRGRVVQHLHAALPLASAQHQVEIGRWPANQAAVQRLLAGKAPRLPALLQGVAQLAHLHRAASRHRRPAA